MGKGIIRVSPEFLVQVLRLPEGTKIIDAQRQANAFLTSGEMLWVELKICHPDLPMVPEGEIIPFYDPQFGNELVDEPHYEVRFLGWNDDRMKGEE